MKKAYFKDGRKIFKNNLSRFISIVLITMLGTAFFIGMNAVSPLMKKTAESYMKDNNIYDYELLSNLGYEKEDIEKLKQLNDVKEIQCVYTYDALASFGEKEIVVRLISGGNDESINKNYLDEGREIQNDSECLISSRLKDMYEFEIGDKIQFYRKDDSKIDDSKIDDSLAATEFEIVGIAKNPKFLSKFYGNTSLSTGEIHSYVIVNESVFKLKEYTNIYIKSDIDENTERFSQEYIDKNDEQFEIIDNLNIEIAESKYDKIYKENFDKLKENEEKVNTAEKYLKKKNNLIQMSQIELNESITNVAGLVAQFYNTPNLYENIYQKKEAIENIYEQLDNLQEEKDSLENSFDELEPQVSKLKNELDLIQNNMEKNLYEIYSLEDEAARFVSLSEENFSLSYDYNERNREYEEKYFKYIEIKKNIEKNNEEISDNKKKIDDWQKELYNSFQGLKDLVAGMNDIGTTQLYNQLEDAKSQLEEGKNNLIKLDAEEKIARAKEIINEQRNELNQFKVITNTTPLYKNSGFKSLKEDLKKIAIMGKIFPVMFFVIAILVTITTITRMIEEDRKNIGTLKALGYSNKTITRRYLIYALLAGLIGGVLGSIIGSYAIVDILFVSYSAMYDLPDLVTKIDVLYIIIAMFISLISTVLFAWIVTKKSLKENAATLMRPRLETSGKRILLERIPFIWDRFSFLFKICFRNIFRYKKRLFMTLIGIAGCTALIYAGLGLQNAIDSIGNKQFKDIRKVSLEIYLKEDYSIEEVKEIEEDIKSQKSIKELTPIRQQALTIQANDNSEDIFYIAIDGKDADNYISMQDRKTKEKINLNDDGIVITEKLADILDVKTGEKIEILDGNINATVKIIGITENYLYNYIYFTPGLYERIYGSQMQYNQIFANLDELSSEEESELLENIKLNENIASTVMEKNLEKEFKTSLSSLMSIVILFLVCAGLLSFTVLINLNNINIEERKRELSTIKLLGFYKREIESYVFRENIILTLLGTLLGLILGMAILGIIIQAAEVETIFLVKDIYYLGLIISVVITITFTLITNFIMKRKLKNIDMIDSLKSIE